MNLQNNTEMAVLAVLIIGTIDEYYDCSFKVSNENCFGILLKLIEQLEALVRVMKDANQEHELRDILHEIANAMVSQDYVLIRDLLHYELRSKLDVLQK